MNDNIRRTTLRHLLFAVLMAIGLETQTAHAWWNSDWTMRKKITIDTTANGVPISDPIGETSVLIRLFDGNFQFANAKEDGGDIRFVASDDKTALRYHIEKWDAQMGEAFIWVRVPDLKHNSQTSFWLYFGNGTQKAIRADDPKGTYDSATTLVYHFSEKNQPPGDASGNNNNAANAGIPVEGSMIGGGIRLTGTTTVSIPASPSLAWERAGTLTWSAWIKLNALKPKAPIFSRGEQGRRFVIGSDNGVPYVEIADGGESKHSPAGEAVQVNTWHHLAVVANSGNVVLFLDGESYSTLNAQIPTLATPGILGSDPAVQSADDARRSAMSIDIDELEISRTSRPAGFVKFAAISQGGEKSGKLLNFAPDETPSNWFSGISSGYVGIIVRSLTADGWAVIGLLSVMAAISWYIMITKATYLNASAKGNALFMNAWGHLANDLTALDHGDADSMKTLGGRVDKDAERTLRNSGVYRIYHIGAEEIRHRLAADREPGIKMLKARSIQAIRASLDSGLVRETQKLNSKMVLLTIAISGGPFLGLLGTVIGVMITFAAVAAAGDVNVNAIAPGIAAALLATVAGLGVAIPSLFGYNYLLARVKDATSDMQVFVDEFVSKMAEFYGGNPDRADNYHI